MATELLTVTSGTAPGGKSRIVLVEDHAILREGLRALLELEQDLRIVGEATNQLVPRGPGASAIMPLAKK